MKRIYRLRDPRDGAVRYVGATSYTLRKRLQMHVTLSVRNTCLSAAWVRELVALRLQPQVELIAETDDWQAAEQDAIASARAAGAQLLNQTDGGMGVRGCKPSEATRAKRSATLKARYANDPAQLAARQELARQAARSDAGRRAASERMTAKWAARRAGC